MNDVEAILLYAADRIGSEGVWCGAAWATLPDGEVVDAELDGYSEAQWLTSEQNCMDGVLMVATVAVVGRLHVEPLTDVDDWLEEGLVPEMVEARGLAAAEIRDRCRVHSTSVLDSSAVLGHNDGCLSGKDSISAGFEAADIFRHAAKAATT